MACVMCTWNLGKRIVECIERGNYQAWKACSVRSNLLTSRYIALATFAVARVIFPPGTCHRGNHIWDFIFSWIETQT